MNRNVNSIIPAAVSTGVDLKVEQPGCFFRPLTMFRNLNISARLAHSQIADSQADLSHVRLLNYPPAGVSISRHLSRIARH